MGDEASSVGTHNRWEALRDFVDQTERVGRDRELAASCVDHLHLVLLDTSLGEGQRHT